MLPICRLLRYRRDVRLASHEWNLFDRRDGSPVYSLEDIEIVGRRLIRDVPAIFGRVAVEIFLFEETTYGGIFARSMREDLLRSLGTIRGLNFSGSVPVDASYVDALIESGKKEHERRLRQLKVGSFVRLLDGFTRGYCGTIQEIRDRIASVRIDIEGGWYTVRTPLGNLENLSHVPKGNRVFYCGSKGEHGRKI